MMFGYYFSTDFLHLGRGQTPHWKTTYRSGEEKIHGEASERIVCCNTNGLTVCPDRRVWVCVGVLMCAGQPGCKVLLHLGHWSIGSQKVRFLYHTGRLPKTDYVRNVSREVVQDGSMGRGIFLSSLLVESYRL